MLGHHPRRPSHFVSRSAQAVWLAVVRGPIIERRQNGFNRPHRAPSLRCCRCLSAAPRRLRQGMASFFQVKQLHPPGGWASARAGLQPRPQLLKSTMPLIPNRSAAAPENRVIPWPRRGLKTKTGNTIMANTPGCDIRIFYISIPLHKNCF